MAQACAHPGSLLVTQSPARASSSGKHGPLAPAAANPFTEVVDAIKAADIEPEGQPPTKKLAATVVASDGPSVIHFSGTFGSLLHVLATGGPGLVVDLQGQDIAIEAPLTSHLPSLSHLSEHLSCGTLDSELAASDASYDSCPPSLCLSTSLGPTAAEPATDGTAASHSAAGAVTRTASCSVLARGDSATSETLSLPLSSPPRVSDGGGAPLAAAHALQPAALPSSMLPLLDTDTVFTPPMSSPCTPPASKLHAQRALVTRSLASLMLAKSRRSQATAPGSPRYSLRQSCEIDHADITDLLRARDGPAPPAPVAFVLRACGVTLRNGGIRLPEGGVLLVDGGAVTLQDVSVSGAGADWRGSTSFPLLYAHDATLTLRGVRVTGNRCGHGVGLGPGAAATLEGCVFDGHDLCGLLARGAGCSLVARGCTFRGNAQDGAVIARGASAAFSQCAFTGNGMLGLDVAHDGTAATARGCQFGRNHEHGAAAYGGATLTLDSCTVRANRVGIVALDAGTRVVADACTLTCNKEIGLHVCMGAQLTAAKTAVSGSRTALEAAHAGTRADLTRCSLAKSAEANIVVTAAATVALTGGSCNAAAGKGASVLHPGSVLEASGAEFAANGSSGVHIAKMGAARLLRCKLLSNSVSGLHVSDNESRAELTECTLGRNATIGAFANKAAFVALADCQLLANGSSGCEARDRLTRMVLTHCVVQRNKRVGVYSHSAATIDMFGVAVADNGVKALLVGGRSAVDIGGGTVEYDAESRIAGGVMTRHSGRALHMPAGKLPVDCDVALLDASRLHRPRAPPSDSGSDAE